MKRTTSTHKLALAALHLAKNGWPVITHDKLAKAAKLPLAEVRKQVPELADLLPLIVEYISAEMQTAVGKFSPEDSVQDRLFEIIMARLDILQRHRQAILNIAAALRGHPADALKLICAERSVVEQIVALAGLAYRPPQKILLNTGLSTIFLLVLRQWQKDDTDDMSKTMAALARYLQRASQLAKFVF